jgi:hypothetical protein
MVTTRNSAHRNTTNSDGEGNLLSDKLILVLKSNEHATSMHGDTLIYVHKKPRYYNMCEKSISAKCASYKRALEAKLMVNTETTQGGKSFVC